MKRKTTYLLAAGLLALSNLIAGAALAQLPKPPGLPGLPSISGSLEGAISPGVYGRIDIGGGRPPPLIYAQPVIIQRPAVYIQEPLYLHVPPGHAKKWSKHCGNYNACGRQVYFVRVNGDDEYGRDSHKRKDYEHGRGRDQDDNDRGYRGRDDGHGNGHGNGHKRGKGKKDRDD